MNRWLQYVERAGVSLVAVRHQKACCIMIFICSHPLN